MHQNGKECTFLSTVPLVLVKTGCSVDCFFSSVFPLVQAGHVRALARPENGGYPADHFALEYRSWNLDVAILTI